MPDAFKTCMNDRVCHAALWDARTWVPRWYTPVPAILAGDMTIRECCVPSLFRRPYVPLQPSHIQILV
jgi:hypothetical protein